MISPPNRRASVAVAMAAFVALLSALLAPAIATAQPAGASLTVTSHALDDETTFVASVALGIAGADLGALSAVLSYDRSVLEFSSCTPGDTVVCNEIEGEVHFAGFDVDGFSSDEHFLDIEFVVLERPERTGLEIFVVTAADVFGGETDSLAAVSGTVTFLGSATPPVPTGGINGEVLDGAGVGVFGAQVCAVSTAGEQACTVTTGLGAFVLAEVSAGSHSLIVSDPNDVLPTTSLLVEVAEGEVTTGVSVSLVPGQPDAEQETQAIGVPVPEEPTAPELSEIATAEAGQIVVQVSAVDGGFAVFGVEVCATMPLIGTQACGFSDTAGVVQLADLAVGNYELTAVDSAGRFDPATPIFVGLNPGEGVNARLGLPGLGLGTPPEVLAFVDPIPRSEATGFALSGVGLALLTAVGVAYRRRDDLLGA